MGDLSADGTALPEPLASLVRGLGEAEHLFQTGDNGGREGAIHALESVVKFLLLSPPIAARGLQAPLAALLGALMNLDDGRTPVLLRAIPSAGRGRANAVFDGVVGAAVFTVRRLQTTGLPFVSARKAVATVLDRAGVAASRGRYTNLTERTVRGWCERVDADVGRRTEAAQTFHGLVAHTPIPDDSVPAQRIREIYLRLLADSVLRLRGADA